MRSKGCPGLLTFGFFWLPVNDIMVPISGAPVQRPAQPTIPMVVFLGFASRAINKPGVLGVRYCSECLAGLTVPAKPDGATTFPQPLELSPVEQHLPLQRNSPHLQRDRLWRQRRSVQGSSRPGLEQPKH